MKYTLFRRDKHTGKVTKITDGLTVSQARAMAQKSNNRCLSYWVEFTTEKNFRESYRSS